MKILVGSVCKQDPEVLAAHIKTLKWQNVEAELDFLWINDNDPDSASSALLIEAGRVECAEPKPETAMYAVREDTHQWNIPTFHWLAQQKQRLLNEAATKGYDAIWLVDSDLLCGPETLASLLTTEKEVVSAVFWTAWQPNTPQMPQVWEQHPYGFSEDGAFLRKLEQNQLVSCRGLGACTLIRTTALHKGLGYWPLMEGLPNEGMWQGEDRHFCVRAQRLHVELWADAWPNVWHCYRPSDKEHIDAVLAELSAPASKITPSASVSFIVEPLEEATLIGYKQHIRGEMTQLPLAPELRTALLGMSAGEQKIIRLSFPTWWPYVGYRGAHRTIRISVLHVRSL